MVRRYVGIAVRYIFHQGREQMMNELLIGAIVALVVSNLLVFVYRRRVVVDSPAPVRATVIGRVLTLMRDRPHQEFMALNASINLKDASRDTCSGALVKLCADGMIRRVARGVYVYDGDVDGDSNVE